MNNPQSRMNWNSPNVNRYGETISLKIPGYGLLHDMTDRILNAINHSEDTEDTSLDVLIVGAGGGHEIVTLGSKHDNWTFTGIDPSEPMLKIAESRINQAELGDRVSLIKGTVDKLPLEKRYDGATCMLVLHFVKGMQHKLELLRGISARLKPGAPLLLASLNGEPQTQQFATQMQAWETHMLDNGITQEEWERFAASIGQESDPISAEDVAMLLQEAGFTHTSRYFGSYLIEGYFCFKSADTME
ncbi:class I SAM-dependent methyltransferase [Paenibacillus baimaensis]|nr:class I SAM-dependent methyltransferase [Paenibacillus sp. WQ 127069]